MGVRLPFDKTTAGGKIVYDYTLTQPFHEYPTWYNPQAHLALDMVGWNGQIARAINAGRVWRAGWEADGWAIGGGWSAIIFHGPQARPTMRSSYCHGKGLYVADGQLVLPGQPMIACDTVGNATGSHLHHDIQLWDFSASRWVPVDPLKVFPTHRYRNGLSQAGAYHTDGRTLTALVVTGAYVNFRSGPATTHPIAATLRGGTVLVFDGSVVGGSTGPGTSRVWNRGWWMSPAGWRRGYLYGPLSKVA